MKHILGILIETIRMLFTYLNIALIVIFDAVIFAAPMMLIYNFVFASNFQIPKLGYFEFVGAIIFLKLIAVLWKSVHMEAPNDVNK